MADIKQWQEPAHLVGWTGWGKGLVPGELQFFIFQLFLICFTHCLLVTAFPPAQNR